MGQVFGVNVIASSHRTSLEPKESLMLAVSSENSLLSLCVSLFSLVSMHCRTIHISQCVLCCPLTDNTWLDLGKNNRFLYWGWVRLHVTRKVQIMLLPLVHEQILTWPLTFFHVFSCVGDDNTSIPWLRLLSNDLATYASLDHPFTGVDDSVDKTIFNSCNSSILSAPIFTANLFVHVFIPFT